MSLPDPIVLIDKLYQQIIKDIDTDTCLIGIPNGGHLILNELKKKIKLEINYGLIDCSYYRDDLDASENRLSPK